MNRTETDTAWAKQAIRDVTLRATPARVAVLKLLASKGVPMSHSEVVVSLAELGFDQSTLFRCLNEMAHAGLLSRLDLGDHTRRFELKKSSDGAEFPHAHFMCVDCGELQCMDDYSLPDYSIARPPAGQPGYDH